MADGSITLGAINVNPVAIAPNENITVSVAITSRNQQMKNITAGLIAVVGNERYVIAKAVKVSKTINAGATKTVTLNMRSLESDEEIYYTNSSGQPTGTNRNVFAYLKENQIRGISSVYISVMGITWTETQMSTKNYPSTKAVSGTCSAICGRINPYIKQFNVFRSSYSGGHYVLDDEGTSALLTLRLGVSGTSDITDTDWAWQIAQMKCDVSWLGGEYKLRFSNSIPRIIHEESGGGSVTPIGSESALITDLITTGLTQSDILAVGLVLANVTFDNGFDYPMTATFYDNYESAEEPSWLPESFANVHLADCGKGVAFGKFSASTASNPLFECEYKSIFSGGVDLSSLFVVAEAQVTASVSSASPTFGAVASITSYIPSGYTAIGIVGRKLSGNTQTILQNLYLQDNNTMLSVSGRYTGSSSDTSITVTAYILCVHTG